MDIVEKFKVYFGPHADKGKVLCPWHDDKDPSLSLDLSTGKYHCFGCGKSGHVNDLVPDRKTISEETVDRFHTKLLSEEPAMVEWLRICKGFSLETIKKYKIGFNGARYTFPVRDENKNCINLKMYSASAQPKMINFAEGYGTPAFFPSPPEEDDIFLMEGESDTLLARQMGLPAYTQTSGSGSWTDDLTRAINGKSVTIVYDADTAGRMGAKKVLTAIKFAVKSVKIISLQVSAGNKDFSDWILKDGGTIDQFKKLVEDTAPYVFSRIDIDFTNTTDMHIVESLKAENAFKSVKCNVIIAGKDRAPYIIPKKIAIECSPGSKRTCPVCPNEAGRKEYVVDWKDGRLLLFVDSPESSKLAIIKKMADIPEGCRGCRAEILEYQNIEKLAMLPYKQWFDAVDTMASDMTIRKGFFVGVGMKANTAYIVKGLPIPDPKDQSCAFLVIEADPVSQNEGPVDMAACEYFREEIADAKCQEKAAGL